MYQLVVIFTNNNKISTVKNKKKNTKQILLLTKYQI